MAAIVERRKKVIFRRLPQFLTEEEFRNMISPIPPHNYFRFCAYDRYYNGGEFSRAYINFMDAGSARNVIEKFNDYVFIDSKGNESPAEVSYALNQDNPKALRARRDKIIGSIEDDELYKRFLEDQKEKSKLRESGDGEKSSWEAVLEEIERLESNPIPETETNLLRSLANKLERRKGKGPSKRNKTSTKSRNSRRNASDKSESGDSAPPTHRPPKSKKLPKSNKNRQENPTTESKRTEKSDSESSVINPQNSQERPRNTQRGGGKGRSRHPPSYSALHAKTSSATSVNDERRPRQEEPVPPNRTNNEFENREPHRRPRGGSERGRGARRGHGPPRGGFSYNRSRGGGRGGSNNSVPS